MIRAAGWIVLWATLIPALFLLSASDGRLQAVGLGLLLVPLVPFGILIAVYFRRRLREARA